LDIDINATVTETECCNLKIYFSILYAFLFILTVYDTSLTEQWRHRDSIFVLTYSQEQASSRTRELQTTITYCVLFCKCLQKISRYLTVLRHH